MSDRTHPDSGPGAVYAALPEPITYQIAALKACEHGDALVGWRVEPSRQSFDASMRPKRKLYTEGNMHDFADRTHALRVSHWQAPAQETPTYKDSTPDLHIGDSAFESWYSSYNPMHKGDKQRACDAYAAGMGDSLVMAAPATVAGCTRSHPHENMDNACRAKAALAEMRSKAARGAEATAHDLDRFVVMLTSAPPTQQAPQQEPSHTAVQLAELVCLAKVAISECNYAENEEPQDWIAAAMRVCRAVAATHSPQAAQADPLQPVVALQEIAGMYADDFKPQADRQPAPAAVAGPVAVLKFERGTPGRENEMPRVVSCNWMPDGEYEVYLAAAPTAQPAPQQEAQEPVAVVVPCHTPSGKRVALYSAKQDLPIGTKLYTATPQPAPAAEWQDISTAPKDGRTLLLGYFNSAGNWRTLRGRWVSEDYISAFWKELENGEPGWYECAVEADNEPNCWATDPTHWIPLHSPPARKG